MPEKRYVVPEGMRRAFFDEAHDGPTWNHTECEHMLTAAIQWLAEHPIVPTNEQAERLIRDATGDIEAWGPVEWQRRMFLAPNNVGIEDLLIPSSNVYTTRRDREQNQLVSEAYRRGREDGAKNGRV